MPLEMNRINKQYECPCQTQCWKQHSFRAAPIYHSKAWLKTEVNIDFCPIINEYGVQGTIPTLNNDGITYLPGFIMECEKIDCQTQLAKHREEHERKILEHTTKKTVLLIPKPGRKHRYCGVCKKQYDEYLEHIQTQSHISNFKSNRYVDRIKNIIKENYGDGNMSQEKKVLYSDEELQPSLNYQESSTQQKNPIIIEDDNPVQKKRVVSKNIPPNSTQTAKDKKENKIDQKEQDLLQNQSPMRQLQFPVFNCSQMQQPPQVNDMQMLYQQHPLMCPYLTYPLLPNPYAMNFTMPYPMYQGPINGPIKSPLSYL